MSLLLLALALTPPSAADTVRSATLANAAHHEARITVASLLLGAAWLEAAPGFTDPNTRFERGTERMETRRLGTGGENFRRNPALADRVRDLAGEKGCTPAQLARAWLIRRHGDVVPIPGTSSSTRLEENVAAADVGLTAGDLDRIERRRREARSAANATIPKCSD
jgi:aryl-alcohol dehydrogenase-like predicted oxidoreductase